MKIKKVIILGIDSIEHDLVEQWNLKNLKQKEYGKTILPLEKYQEPVTIIIWPCFITGKKPKEMGYNTVKIFPRPIQYFIDFFYPNIRSLLIDRKAEDLKQKKKGKQKFLDRFSQLLKKINIAHSPTKKDIKAETIFENKDFRSIHMHIPVYDKDAFPKYRKKVVKALEDKKYRPILEMACRNEFKLRSKEFFSILERKNNWDLFMQYFFVLDAVQHVYFNNKKKMAEFYIMFDEFVGKVKEKIDKETLLLIVSDHGQKKGMHTPYGFYSTNKKLGLKNPKLIDFKTKIEELIKK